VLDAPKPQKQSNPDREQIGGQHYKLQMDDSQQHWNLAVAHNWDYFQAQIIKYVMRWKDKGGIEDLKKAEHFLLKYLDVAGNYQHAKMEMNSNRGDLTIARRAVQDRIKNNGENQWPHPKQAMYEGGPAEEGGADRRYVDQG
jgi:hypothetical protein